MRKLTGCGTGNAARKEVSEHVPMGREAGLLSVVSNGKPVAVVVWMTSAAFRVVGRLGYEADRLILQHDLAEKRRKE